ncbi:MAG: hypothetical protein DHS20C18_02000 [Saprospiraceae bacterium]|nr:MAG: hypothetical protein DHS20C18_02000 [Saprospiraceae bacterium]
MTRKVFKEEQKFKYWEVYILLVFFMGISLTRLVSGLLGFSEMETLPSMIYLLILTSFGLVFWYLHKLKMIIKVDEKGLTIRYFPKFFRKRTIKWDDIQDCRFIRTPEMAEWSGWGVHFALDEETHSLCGRTGLHIITKEGKKYFIGSKRIVEKKDTIKKFLSTN